MAYKVVSKDGKQIFGAGYATEEDAQAFIDSHIAAKGAKVVEEEDESEDEAE